MYKLEVPGDRPRVPKLGIVIISLLIVGVIALVVLIGSQRPDSSTRDGSIEFVIATEEVAQNKDIVIGVNNATLYVPQNAINVGGTISITPRPPNLFSIAENNGWSRTLIVNVEYRNDAGTPVPLVTFTTPFLICFKVSPERWQDYLSRQDEYQVQYYAETQNPPVWEPVSMVTFPERYELCGEADHFSLFALAVKTPQSETPFADVTPTPKPKTLLDLLSDIIDPQQPDGVYEP